MTNVQTHIHTYDCNACDGMSEYLHLLTAVGQTSNQINHMTQAKLPCPMRDGGATLWRTLNGS
jgi:hypothetical protein